MLKKVLEHFFKNSGGWLVALILTGTLTWSLVMVKSGVVYPFGMGFWGPNGHDGVWHISLAQSLARGSWDMPVFAGQLIKNYHLGFDFFLAALHKLTFIPIHTLYFQILPPIMAFLIGYFTFKFSLQWRNSKLQALMATFFVYFGGSWGWLVTLIREGEIGGESLFWSQQSISTLLNPPFALSILIIFAGLSHLLTGLRKKSKKHLLICTVLFGMLIQIKVYAGALVLGALLVSGVLSLIKRGDFALIKVFLGAFIISVVLFLPVISGVGQVLIFKPFWFLETMMALSDRFNWPRF